MLDHKIDDADASVELLKNREKKGKMFFLFFYILGFGGTTLFGFVIPFNWMVAEMIGFFGIACMVIGTWFLITVVQYDLYLFLIKKGMIKAKEEREL
jgi:hypothetical protein